MVETAKTVKSCADDNARLGQRFLIRLVRTQGRTGRVLGDVTRLSLSSLLSSLLSSVVSRVTTH